MDQQMTARLLEQARAGDRAAVGMLLEAQRERLHRMLGLRLDGRLRGRVDAADVIQDTFLVAAQRLGDYLLRPTMPFYLWVRFLATQRLQEIYRENLGAQKRDLRREVSYDEARGLEATSEALAAHLLGKFTSPSQEAVRAELRARLSETLESMEPIDREIIALRHFEQLSNADAAQVLGLNESAASKRYLRALRKLRELLAQHPGMSEFTWK